MAVGNFSSNTPGVPAVSASATAAGPGSNGVYGNTRSAAGSAVYGEHLGTTGIGVFGRGGPDGGEGVFGQATSGSSGVYGKNTVDTRSSPESFATSNPGVTGESASGTGVLGVSNLAGVSNDLVLQGGIGVVGINNNVLGTGVFGQADAGTGTGVSGSSQDGLGVAGSSTNGIGISGNSTNGTGIFGSSTGPTLQRSNGPGVVGISDFGAGVRGESDNVGIYAHNLSVPITANDAYLGARGFAGDFHGNVSVLGRIYKFGGGFRIDHPLDPAAKYFSHSFVESSDMKNIYDGIAILDSGGEAEVELPSWLMP